MNLVLFMGACTSDSPVVDPVTSPIVHPVAPPFDFSKMKNGDQIPIYYTENDGASFTKEYKAIKIGEYLWMNTNFTYPIELEVTQHQINFALDACRIDTTVYSITPSEVNEYIGQYYSQASIRRMNESGNMFETDAKYKRGKWGVPVKADFQQLFGMCGDGQEFSVRSTLSYRVGEIPLMRKTTNAFWITDGNTNKYGFNLIYSGQRAHVDDFTWWTCHDYPNDCFTYVVKRGGFAIFYTTAVYPADNGTTTVMLHDYPDTKRGQEWALKPMRWCRELTDEELGYKLYVNKDRSDIVKLGLEDTPPSGYEELRKGYLRGFYVQYILNNPAPAYTVSQLREMELELPDVMYGGAFPT